MAVTLAHQWLVKSSGEKWKICQTASLVLIFGQIGTVLCDDHPDILSLVCSSVFLLNILL